MSQSRFKEYTNSKAAITLNYPQSWTVAPDEYEGNIMFHANYPLHGEDNIESGPCLHVQVQGMSPRLTLEEFTSESKRDIALRFRAEVEVSDLPMSGIHWKCFKYSMDAPPFRAIQIFTQKGRAFYIITYASPSDVFYKWLSDIEECFKSVKIHPLPETSIHMRRFINEKYLYSLLISTSWNQTLPDNSQRVVQFQEDEVRLIIAMDTLPNGSDLGKFTRIMESQIRESDPKLSLKIEDAHLDTLPAKKISYLSNTLNLKGRFFQVWAVKSGSSCVITLIFQNADERDAQVVANCQQQFDRILDSFKVHSSVPKAEKSHYYQNCKAKVALEFPSHFRATEIIPMEVVSFMDPSVDMLKEVPVTLTLQLVYNATNTAGLEEAPTPQHMNRKESEITIGGIRGKQISCEIELEGIGIMQTQQRLVFNPNTKVALILICSALKTKQEEFKRVSQYLDTFRFL